MKNTIKSVDSALDLLEAFSQVGDEIDLDSLCSRVNMNKSVVCQLLRSFTKKGYVVQRQRRGDYRLGMTAHKVGQNILSNMKLVSTARPLMEKIRNDCNEDIYLALPCNHDIHLFEQVSSLNVVSVLSLKGRTYPTEACAAGEVVLAFSKEQSPVFREMISVPADRLLEVRQQGFSTDVDRLGDGVASLAVPLLDKSNAAVGSLCAVGPTFRFSDQKIQEGLLTSLVEAGHAVSTRLGYYGYYLT